MPLVAFVLALAAPPLPVRAADTGPVTGFPMPRFVSVRVGEANLRVGPGRYFPIRTVLVRKGMPVKVIDEFQEWRQVELYDGEIGWLHLTLVSGRRTFLVRGGEVAMREEPDPEADLVARLADGALAHLRECNPDWCFVAIGDYDGWIPRGAGWGILPGEVFER